MQPTLFVDVSGDARRVKFLQIELFHSAADFNEYLHELAEDQVRWARGDGVDDGRRYTLLDWRVRLDSFVDALVLYDYPREAFDEPSKGVRS